MSTERPSRPGDPIATTIRLASHRRAAVSTARFIRVALLSSGLAESSARWFHNWSAITSDPAAPTAGNSARL